MQDLDLIPLRHGSQSLDSQHATTCTLADTYYKISGTWISTANFGFESDGTGKMTYVDGDGVNFLFNGVSDVKSNKNCEIYYGLFKNGVLVPAAQTPHDFDAANKVHNISITAIITGLQYGDYLEIFCKSDIGNTIITSKTLLITLWGDR